VFFFIGLSCNAQEEDANLWLTLGARKLIDNKSSVTFNLGTRLANNMQWRNYQFAQLTYGRKIRSWLSVAAGARIYQQTLPAYTRNKYRLLAELTVKKKLGTVSVSNRLRYQYDKSLIYNYELALLPAHKLRDKIELTFRKGKKLQPSLSGEVWYDFRAKYQTFNNFRLKAGADYQYNKHQGFSVNLLYDQPFNQIDVYTVSYIISCGYLYTF
jgi:Protein of unknown function (DUF2490)